MKTVVTIGGGWLAGEAGSKESPIQKVAASISGEDSPGSVAPVGGGRQADHE